MFEFVFALSSRVISQTQQPSTKNATWSVNGAGIGVFSGKEKEKKKEFETSLPLSLSLLIDSQPTHSSAHSACLDARRVGRRGGI